MSGVNGKASADSGEVDKLRLELEHMTKLRDTWYEQYQEIRAGKESLRAQLAERDALLRDALQDCLDLELMRMLKGSIYINRISDRIKSVLGETK